MSREPVTIKSDYIIDLKGKQYVKYEGILATALENGLVSLKSEIIQYPSEQNRQTCIAQAIAVFKDGDGIEQVFSDYGDASPASVGATIAVHFIRMASTRAKARCLKDGLGIAGCSFEETGGEDAEERTSHQREAQPDTTPRPPARTVSRSAQGDASASRQNNGADYDSGEVATENQIKAIKRICEKQNWEEPDMTVFTKAKASRWIQKYQAQGETA